MISTSDVLRPLLVLVGGKPGTGKSKLAHRLSQPEILGLPYLSRDAIKVGLVESYALAAPTLARIDVESDLLRKTIVPKSFALFHDTIQQWLSAGVSLIAEHNFTQRSIIDINPLNKIATVVYIECWTSAQEAQRRFIERERQDPRHRPDRLAEMQARIDQGIDPWSTPATFILDVSTLRVDTTCGYTPALEHIADFCRGAMAIYSPHDIQHS